MRKDILVSTTNVLEGYEIEKYLGICSERVVVGVGFFSEFYASFTDIFGGRSRKFEERLNELYECAMEKLIKSACNRGANALIGVSMDIDEISGKGTQMFMVSVVGTAVLAKNNIEPAELNYNCEGTQLEGNYVKNELVTRRLIKDLNNCNNFEELKKIISELYNENIILPLDSIFSIINNKNISFTQSVIQYPLDDEFRNYFDQYEKTSIGTYINQIAEKADTVTNLFIPIYAAYAIPDYRIILQLIDKASYATIDLLLPALYIYKEFYDNNDLRYLIEIRDKLDKKLNDEIVEITHGFLNSESWICLCGHKVSDGYVRCSNCCKGKNGLVHEQEEKIKETLEYLDEIINILNCKIKM